MPPGVPQRLELACGPTYLMISGARFSRNQTCTVKGFASLWGAQWSISGSTKPLFSPCNIQSRKESRQESLISTKPLSYPLNFCADALFWTPFLDPMTPKIAKSKIPGWPRLGTKLYFGRPKRRSAVAPDFTFERFGPGASTFSPRLPRRIGGSPLAEVLLIGTAWKRSRGSAAARGAPVLRRFSALRGWGGDGGPSTLLGGERGDDRAYKEYIFCWNAPGPR